MGLPASRVTIEPICCFRSAMISPALRMISALAGAGVRRQAGKAFFAAWTARSSSPSGVAGATQITSRVSAGFID